MPCLPCTCDSRRAVAQFARDLVADVRAELVRGAVPHRSTVLTERLLCAAIAIGSEPLAHFLLATEDDPELWQLPDQVIVVDAGIDPEDVAILAVCRAWWPWLHVLRSAELEDTDEGERAQRLLAAMPSAWFAHRTPCPRAHRVAS
jgi:hypothetical protein